MFFSLLIDQPSYFWAKMAIEKLARMPMHQFYFLYLAISYDVRKNRLSSVSSRASEPLMWCLGRSYESRWSVAFHTSVRSDSFSGLATGDSQNLNIFCLAAPTIWKKTFC